MHKYHLNSEQQAQILRDLEDTAKRIIGINFANPEQDQPAIRHHAYLMGKLEYQKQMLDDEFPDAELQQPEND